MMSAKTFICGMLGYREGVSVRRGRGTSWDWIYISTQQSVDRDLRVKIEAKLVEFNLVGQYLSDSLPGGNTFEANVLWEVR